MRRLISSAPLLGLLWLAACSDSTAPRRVPTTVQLSQPSLSLSDGDTARLTATVLDQNGKAMQPLPRSAQLVWSSSDTVVATVVDGLVTARRPGTAQIGARAGEAVGTIALTVKAVPTAVQAAGDTLRQGVVATAVADSLGVRVIDRHGLGVAGVAVAFSVSTGGGTLSGSSATTGPDGVARVGWILGVRSGPQAVLAQVPGIAGSVSFHAAAAPGAPAEVRLGGSGQAAAAGTRLPEPLAATVLDAHGNLVSGAKVVWAVASGGGSISPERPSTDSVGVARARWTLGPEVGEQHATVLAGELPAVTYAAQATAGPPLPVLSSISPAMLTPGVIATVTGQNFSATASENAVTVAGVSATVTEATTTRLTFTVPAASQLPCEPTGPAPVVVRIESSSGRLDHPLRTATERSLAVGGAVSVLAAEGVRCNALPAGGEYVVSVFNTATSASARTSFELRATAAGGSAARLPSLSRAPAPQQPSARPPRLSALGAGGNAAHLRLLESNRALAQTLGPRRGPAPRFSRSPAANALPAVGDTLSYNIPNTSAGSLCTGYTAVRARVVHVGEHAIVLEDVAAPLAGKMDADFRAIGEEYDRTMHSLVLENFGSPLAVDAQTDGNGKLLMLFSKVVSDDNDAIAGFVFPGDFFPTAQCAGSNQAEIFYARVPTSTESGFAADTRAGWMRGMRPTIIHEVKHLTSFAERLSDPNASAWEDVWLEESTARISEELWARGVFGYRQKGNTDYPASIYCEVRPTSPECGGKPLVMLDHFADLYDYAMVGGGLTPLGKTGSTDYTFYGSGWSLVRWAIDHAEVSESAFLRALTQEPNLSGVKNLEARTGRGFAELLAEWSLALALDDRPHFTPALGRLSFPSWDTRDIFAGMNGDFPEYWKTPRPHQIRRVSLDGSATAVSSLRGGAASLFSIPTGTEAPVVEVRGANQSPPPAGLRLAIVRVR